MQYSKSSYIWNPASQNTMKCKPVLSKHLPFSNSKLGFSQEQPLPFPTPPCRKKSVKNQAERYRPEV